MSEDEMVGWHHRLNGHEFEQALEMAKDRETWCVAVHGVTKTWTQLSDCTELNCSIERPLEGHKESDMVE